jgi:catechol 2,3-dioxygenase-like lactoylglutathione lyase family enzyme
MSSNALSLDHVVILVHDLEATIVDYTALGFTVQRGGTHADGNTHNALVGFADGSYLELIAFKRPTPQHRWGAAAASGREGFVDFALLPPDVRTVVEDARARGLAYEGPLDGGRVRPDGEQLRWQIGTPPAPDLPFLCGDITPRSLRVREGAVREHANGVTGVAAVTVAVSDVPASLQRWRALLDTASARVATVQPLAGLGLLQAVLPLGAATLVLVGPGPDETAGANAALRKGLKGRGEGIVGLTLRAAPGAPARNLPATLTHGAAIDVWPAD